MAVAVRLTEVEAYAGESDGASHAFRGLTPRTRVMFGPPGHLYLYLVYGMHWCANIVTGPDGEASAVLLRAGDVIGGVDEARARRPRCRRDEHLARGPAGLATVLGWTALENGYDLCAPDSRWEVTGGTGAARGPVIAGPRVGVTRAAETPWRFVDDGAPSVSAFRSGGRRTPRPPTAPGVSDEAPSRTGRSPSP
ncbi:DNA-3-methyladenine glycosylase [Nakamurella flavida]|nr:DNA-3-methyladenine glycosylase [Nakamurella flavida]